MWSAKDFHMTESFGVHNIRETFVDSFDADVE